MTYTYKCNDCNTEFEIIKGINEEVKIQCKKCKSDNAKRIFKPIGNVWKCSGSYNQTK